jgi:hypothetical protein
MDNVIEVTSSEMRIISYSLLTFWGTMHVVVSNVDNICKIYFVCQISYDF